MDNIFWNFPPLYCGKIQGLNNSGIETFKGSDINDNLAREICQNSLDAKDPNTEGPVRVEFCLERIKKAEHKALSELEVVFERCKSFCGERITKDAKIKSFFQESDRVFNEDEIAVLIISDYNTKGLRGATCENDEVTPWSALINSDGISDDKGSSSGGSFGIGKSAPFACSALRTVYYNTKALDGAAFQGVANLMTHYGKDRQKTQGTGFFHNSIDLNNAKPIYPENSCSFRDLIKRETFGTDVIIAGFSNLGSWERDIEKAIIKNFFLSIYNEKLVAKVGRQEINKGNLIDLINRHIDDDTIRIIKELYETITCNNEKEFLCEKFTIIDKDDFLVYIKTGEKYSRQIAEFRNTGMLIKMRTKNYMTKYAAVAVAVGDSLNGILRAMEPPRHDKWDPGNLQSDADIREAKKIIEKIHRSEYAAIEKLCKTESTNSFDPDGIANFLPDDADFLPPKGKDKNIYSEEREAAGLKQNQIVNSSSTSAGEQEKGKKEEGDYKGGGKGKTKVKPYNPSDDDGEDETVKTKKNGNKAVKIVNLKSQRILPISINVGVYKVITETKEPLKNLYFSFLSIGDDGTEDEVIIRRINQEGKPPKIGEFHKIGPFETAAEIPLVFEVVIDIKEKVLLNVVAEEIKNADSKL